MGVHSRRNGSTSSSLNAARLFSPCTRASRAKKSLPWRVFHLVEDEDAWRTGCAIALLPAAQKVHFATTQNDLLGSKPDSRSTLSVSCWNIRRESIEACRLHVHHSSQTFGAAAATLATMDRHPVFPTTSTPSNRS